MYIDIGKRIAGKQDGPGPIIYGTLQIFGYVAFLSPTGRMPRTGDIGFMSVRPSIHPS